MDGPNGMWVGLAVVVSVQALLVGGVLYMVFRLLRARKARVQVGMIQPGPGGLDKIPILASFTGLRVIPWVALASNSLNPYLAVSTSNLEYRVIRKHQRPFSDIESIDVRTGPGTVNLEFRFHGRQLTLLVNCGTTTMASAALRRLPRSIPLTPSAQRMLTEET